MLTNTEQQAPLNYAVSYRKSEAVRRQIEEDAAVNLRAQKERERGLTLLVKTASNGDSPIIEELLKSGADVLAQDRNEVTALM